MIGLAIGVLLAAQGQAATVVVRATNPTGGDAELEVVEEVRIGSLEGAVETSFGCTLYVADEQVPAVRVFAADGAYVGDLGQRGQGPGEFETLRGIAALPGGEVAVWHEMDRVTLFGADGAFRRGFSARLMTETMSIPSPHEYLVTGRNDVIDPRGTFLGTVTLPHRAENLFARGPRVWTKEFGDFDEQYVVRYRIEGW